MLRQARRCASRTSVTIIITMTTIMITSTIIIIISSSNKINIISILSII